jgi:hypothetical protein
MDRNDNDWPAIQCATSWAQSVWGQLQHLLEKDYVGLKSMSSFYRSVVQAILLYGLESWVLMAVMKWTLQSFHQSVLRYLPGKHIKPDPKDLKGKQWICLSSERVLEKAGLLPIQDYIKQQRASAEKYITRRPIYQKCLQSKPVVNPSLPHILIPPMTQILYRSFTLQLIQQKYTSTLTTCLALQQLLWCSGSGLNSNTSSVGTTRATNDRWQDFALFNRILYLFYIFTAYSGRVKYHEWICSREEEVTWAYRHSYGNYKIRRLPSSS